MQTGLLTWRLGKEGPRLYMTGSGGRLGATKHASLQLYTRKPSWRWQTRATQNDEKIPPFRSHNKFQSSRKSGVYTN